MGRLDDAQQKRGAVRLVERLRPLRLSCGTAREEETDVNDTFRLVTTLTTRYDAYDSYIAYVT